MKRECFESEQGRFYYEEIKGKLRIVSYVGNASQLKIPGEICGKEVKSIGKKAFLSCKGLKKVVFPEQVDNLGDWAFANCNFLEQVEFPSVKVHLGNGVFQGCRALKCIMVSGKHILDIEAKKQTGALLAAVLNQLDAPHLFSLSEAGTTKWLKQWDGKLLQFLGEEDKRGFTAVVLCGEEDYGSDENSMSYFIRQKRKNKVRLCFLRLLNPIGISGKAKEEFEEYLRNHTKGCASEETWQVVLEEHGNEKEYYKVLTECGCVTEENFQGFLDDLKDNYPEMKAFLMKYKETNLGYEDFFDSLSIDL